MKHTSGLEQLRAAAIQSFKVIPPRVIASQYGVVFTYHATFTDPPCELIGLDNVRPTILFEQITSLKKLFTVVSIDEFCAARCTRGLASITFDDGYKSLVTDCWSVFESLDVPVTFFVNSAFFSKNSISWRDKVRCILNHGLDLEFRAFTKNRLLLSSGDLLLATKDPRINTRIVDAELDIFLKHNCLAVPPHHFFDSPQYLRQSHRVSYGNHSHQHYALSSLSDADQRKEIIETHEFLRRIPGIQLSNVFCAPFGEDGYINLSTTETVKELGYSAMVMNRGGLNRTHRRAPSGLRMIERIMPMENSMKTVLQKEFVKSMLNPRRSFYTSLKAAGRPGSAPVAVL